MSIRVSFLNVRRLNALTVRVDVLVNDKDSVGLLASTLDTSNFLVGRVRATEDLVRLQVAVLLFVEEPEPLDRVPLLVLVPCRHNWFFL